MATAKSTGTCLIARSSYSKRLPKAEEGAASAGPILERIEALLPSLIPD